MRYMLLIYAEENERVRDGLDAGVSPEWFEYTDWLVGRGIHLTGERLASASSATTVRLREGNRLVTDGPYAETKEVLGGYYLLDCRDLDEALEAAARCPGARGGSVEVRPLVTMTLPAGAPATDPALTGGARRVGARRVGARRVGA